MVVWVWKLKLASEIFMHQWISARMTG